MIKYLTQKLHSFGCWVKKLWKEIIVVIAVGIVLAYGGTPPAPEGSVFLPTDSNQKYGVYFDDIALGNGKRGQTISSSPRNVYEDNGWKRIEDAKSLKSVFNVNYLREDEDFSLRIEDFNYSSAKVCLGTTQLNQDIPFKVFALRRTKDGVEKVLEEIKIEGVKSKEPTIRFTDTKEKCFVLNDIYVLNKHLEFGFNSSEVSFDDPTQDGYIKYRDGYTRYNTSVAVYFGAQGAGGFWSYDYRGYVEWDISSLAGETLAANPVFKYQGFLDSATDEEINPITEEPPSEASDEDLYGYIASGTAYVDPFNFETGENKLVDLGTSAKTDLQNAMDASQSWFAIGFQSPDDEGATVVKYAIFYSEDKDPAPTPPPTLYVEYTPEPAGTVKYYFNSTVGGWETNTGNMVDGSTLTFASTTETDNIQENDGNTCVGTDLGTITKVELRFHGYASNIGDPSPSISLFPYFEGSDTGDEHEEFLTTNPFWSSYVDITTDTNAPSPWTWTDVKNLDGLVKSGGNAVTFYCSKVEIRVTYSAAEPEMEVYIIEEM